MSNPNQANRIKLLDQSYSKLSQLIQRLGHKEFRSKQVWKWLHQKNCSDFSQMKNLSKDLIKDLNKCCIINTLNLDSIQYSNDGSIKFLFNIDKNNAIESVLIPEKDRLTLCISTQAGCAMACAFCSTGDQGFNRQLTLGEIVGQLWYVNKYLKKDNIAFKTKVSNVVLMGMGEPLANYRATLDALKIFLDDHAYGLSRRRVTVSTCGLTSAILQLAKDCPVSLAISLHAPNDQLRSQIMPINRRYPIAELINACKQYIKSAPRLKVLIEYVLIKGINDSSKTCMEFAQLIKNLNCKVNLIPFNRYPNSKFPAPNQEQVVDFANKLMKASKKTVIIRKSRGNDIAGACGQLSGKIDDIRHKKIVNNTITEVVLN